MKKLSMLMQIGALITVLIALPFGFSTGIAKESNPDLPVNGDDNIGITLNIAIDANKDEKDPAVAMCTNNQFLVVYERDGDIYGQRLFGNGNFLGTAFEIYNGTYEAFDPAVACDWNAPSGYFVVVFSYKFDAEGTDIDVHGQLVHDSHQASGSQLYGSFFTVSQDSSGVDETNPVVACNSPDDTCLVMFEYSGSGNGDIYGQRLDLGFAAVALDGDRFQISDPSSAIEGSPDIVWNRNDSRYMVVWQDYDSSDGHFRINYVHIYDTEKGPGEIEVLNPIYRLFNPSSISDPDDYNADHVYPSVTYNPQTGNYVATFTVNGSSQNWSYAMKFDYYMTIGSIYKLEDNTSGRSAVAYAGGNDANTGDKGQNEYMAIYTSGATTDYQSVDVGNLPENCFPNCSQFSGDVIDTILETDGWFYNPDVAGTWFGGPYLVVYEIEFNATGNHDILGELINPLSNVYLPLVVK